MKNLFDTGRIFYGLTMLGMGLLTIVYRDFPYMFLPPKHTGIPGFLTIAYVFGAAFTAAGVCIFANIKVRSVALLLGTLLLLVFCFYHIPHGIFIGKYTTLVVWENALKELDLAVGALIIAKFSAEENETPTFKLLGKLIPLAIPLFAITMICYGIVHFQHADQVALYVPEWVPLRLFWAYIAGAGLLLSGVAILINVKVELAAALLGFMITAWFLILHVPRVIMSPLPYLGSEIASALLALGYGGIAFMIPGKRP